MGKALLVDLGKGTTESWDLPQEWCKDYLGGVGGSHVLRVYGSWKGAL